MVCILLLVCLCSCSSKDKEKAYKAEGGAQAFEQYNGKPVTISSSIKKFATKDLSSSYRKAITAAVKKLNATSSQINVIVDETKNTGDYYVGQYNSAETPYYKAEKKSKTFDKTKINSSYIVKSSAYAFTSYTPHSRDWAYIFFNTNVMDSCSENVKLMFALHELGHVIGFIDFTPDTYVYRYDATIMKCDYEKGMAILTDYTEFDKQCIKDVYGK